MTSSAEQTGSAEQIEAVSGAVSGAVASGGFETVAVDPAVGLASAEVEERRAEGRTNAAPPSPVRSLGEIVRANVFTPVNAIMLSLFVLILVARSPRDALFVGVVLSNSVIGIVQEIRAKRALEKLAILNAPRAAVVRDGETQEIVAEEIVADDIIDISSGSQIVVDGEVVSAIGLEVDESLLTGEADPVDKEVGAQVMSGSFVSAGSGRVRATGIGAESYASKLSEEARRFTLVNSDLREGVNKILRVLVVIVPFAAGLLLLALLTNDGGWQEALRSTVGAAVAMVPDGLVLLTSFAFVVGVIVLARRKALAKELATVELLAHVDVLCLDKTGTITTGEISFGSVDYLRADGDSADEADKANKALGAGALSKEFIDEALGAMAAADPNPNPTLAAVAGAFKAPDGWRIVSQEPFSSARKWAAAEFAADSTAGGPSGGATGGTEDSTSSGSGAGGCAGNADGATDGTEDSTSRGVFYFGAPEILLGGADGAGGGSEDDNHSNSTDGNIASTSTDGDIASTGTYSNTSASFAKARATEHASGGSRVLALCHAPGRLTSEELPSNIQPLALVLLEDTIRPDAPEILEYFHRQGVTLKVISGDNPATVSSVAVRAGIPDGDKAMDARDLPEDEAELIEHLESKAVFGRVTPHQKRSMVSALQNRGHTVAMTGDGVNDVLALKDSDIGIAMGSGSDASRAVAQIVLLDNSFATLPRVLSEGRKVINNIERVANLFVAKAVYAVLITAVIGLMSFWVAGAAFPFLPRQLTLIGTFSIGLPGLFLSLAPSESLVKPGFLQRVLRFSMPVGGIAAAGTLIAYEIARRASSVGLDEARTAATMTLLGLGLVILALTARPLELWKLALLAGMAGLYALVLLVPFGRNYFQLELFPAWLWLVCLVATAIGGALIVLAARIVNQRPPPRARRRPRYSASASP